MLKYFTYEVANVKKYPYAISRFNLVKVICLLSPQELAVVFTCMHWSMFTT